MTPADLTPEQREVLLVMPADFAEAIPYARIQAADCGLPVEIWRRTARQLCDLGLARHGVLHNLDDGRPHGSSYWRTAAGDQLAQQLESDR